MISLLGADFRDCPRGLIEALGAGVHLNQGDLALRCNFSTIEDMNSMKIIDRRAGRTLTNVEATQLADAVNSKVKLPYKFELIHTEGHRAVLIFRGAFSANISNIDPSYDLGLSVEKPSDFAELSKPLDDSARAKLTADLVNTFIKKSYIVLDNHPVNIARKKKGFFPANFILCRDAGTGPARAVKMQGSWAGFGYMPLEKGIVKLFGMRLSTFNVPPMNEDDFYKHAEIVLDAAIKNSIKMIEEYSDLVDYIYIHFKETDLPGHDNKPLQKVRFIEMIDKDFFGYLRNLDLDFKMVVTSDHTTSCRMKSHTSNPVPVVFYDSKSVKDSGKRFIEKDSVNGKSFNGRQLLSKTLFLK